MNEKDHQEVTIREGNPRTVGGGEIVVETKTVESSCSRARNRSRNQDSPGGNLHPRKAEPVMASFRNNDG